MKKNLILCALLFTAKAQHIFAMETTGIDDWEVIETKTSTHSNQDWQSIRQIIIDYINTNYKTHYLLQKPSTSTALEIVKIPQNLFPNLGKKTSKFIFNTIFFNNLCEQSNLFKTAIVTITQQSKQDVTKLLTGSTIDSLETAPIPLLDTLCYAVKKYIFQAMYNDFTETKTYTLSGHIGQIYCLDAVNNIIATSSLDQTTRIWNAKSGDHFIISHNNRMNSVSLNHDTSLLATATESGVIAFWATNTGELLYTLKNNDAHNNAYFSKQENTLLTFKTYEYNGSKAYCNSLVQIWNYNNQTVQFVSQIQVPLYAVINFKATTTSYCRAEIAGLFLKDIKVTLSKHTPNLCTIAFENSKNNKHELHQLHNSQTFNSLDEIDKKPLKNKINEQLKKLSQYKQEQKALECKQNNDGIELGSIKSIKNKK